MAIRIALAAAGDEANFAHIAEDVFDGPCPPERVAAYLADPRHHIALARDGEAGGLVVGMCSGVHYFHPDKPCEMFLNEVGVSPAWQRRGIGTRLVAAMCDHARDLGCVTAWAVADPTAEALGFWKSLDAEITGRNLAMFSFDLLQPAHPTHIQGET